MILTEHIFCHPSMALMHGKYDANDQYFINWTNKIFELCNIFCNSLKSQFHFIFVSFVSETMEGYWSQIWMNFSNVLDKTVNNYVKYTYHRSIGNYCNWIYLPRRWKKNMPHNRTMSPNLFIILLNTPWAAKPFAEYVTLQTLDTTIFHIIFKKYLST